LRSLHINAGIAQAPDMVLFVPGRQDMEGALDTIDAITDEREQRAYSGEEKKAQTCRCWRSIERAKGMGAAVEFTVDS
jgi:hypothetical protein